MSCILHESWLGKVAAGWDRVRKLKPWILLLRDETLLKETKYLAFHFLPFWDNVSQKLRVPSHFTKSEQLIRPLTSLPELHFRCRRFVLLVQMKEKVSMSYGSNINSWKPWGLTWYLRLEIYTSISNWST